ncbi:MAG: spore germination protein, partial [Clostridia bacterium]
NMNNDIEKYLANSILSNYDISEEIKFEKIVNEIFFGKVAIFFDGIKKSFIGDILKYEHRNIEKPYFESSIKGPQEAFNECLSINTALIRKNIQSKDLIIETIEIGDTAKNRCAVMYMEGITNKKLVRSIKNRISKIKVDIILSTDTLSQYITTNTFNPIPTMQITERPDRVASSLLEGRCVILTNNTPIALIAPTTIFDWFHSSEDAYLKAPSNITLKIIRIVSMFVAIFLPAIYIATVTYHLDIFPTNIAMTLSASREIVPLSFLTEIIIMEIAFELLREAEMRVPTRIGPVVSIVGGLILGQLAVMANIICSFTMIIIGFTGIALYAIPNFFVSYGLRNIRYVFIILAFVNGYLALALGGVILLLYLANTYSFGTSVLPCVYIDKNRNIIKQIFTTPIWKRELRPYTVDAQNIHSQPKISRRWINGRY